MSVKVSKAKQSVLLFAVFIKDVFDNKTSSNVDKFYYYVLHTFYLFLKFFLTCVLYHQTLRHQSDVCVTVHHFSTTMKTTNKMQQLFRLLIFLIHPYMFRATNSPILRSTF